MQTHKLKVWLSLSTVVFAGSAALAGEPRLPAFDSTAPHDTRPAGDLMASTSPLSFVSPPQLADSGEGGEGGEAGHDSDVSDPVVFIASLARIEAELRAGISQYELGRKERAARHFDQIIDMLNGDMGTALHAQGLDREHVAIEAEALPISARDGDPMEDLMGYLGHLLFELDEHALLVPAELRRHPDFGMLVLESLLDEARDRCQDMFSAETADDQKAFKYESARGLVWTGRDMIGENSSELRDRSTEHFNRLLAAYDGLQDLLSSVDLPGDAINQGAVLSAFSKVELALSPLTEQINMNSYHMESGAGGEGGEGGEGG